MARRMQPSAILVVAGEVRALQEEGIPVADMTVGDFSPAEFPIPAVLRRSIGEALAAGETNYPPPAGLISLRVAIQAHLRRTQGLAYPLESILVMGGARPALYAAYRLLTDPGDTVLYPAPSWNNQNYRDLCDLQERVVVCRPENAFQPTAELLAPHLPAARLLVLNTPQNPSGGVMPAAEVERFGRLLVAENRRRARTGEKPLYLVLDQIYRALVFPGREHLSPVQVVPECAPWVIHVDGISKFCAATGLRVGWMVAPPAIAERAVALLTHVGAWAPRLAQAATADFLQDGAAVAAWEEEMLGRVRERIDLLHTGLGALRDAGLPLEFIEPQGAIYMSVRFALQGRRTPDGTVLASTEDIRRYLLREAAFAVVPFSAFGVPEEEEDGWCRVSVGAVGPADIQAALPRLRRALERLG